MNVASVDLCKELNGLSRWDYDSTIISPESPDKNSPGYSLGFLLRKLPGYIALTSTTWDDVHTEKPEGQELDYQAVACYQSNIKRLLIQQVGDTPEDAVCRLAIELFKQGILER